MTRIVEHDIHVVYLSLKLVGALHENSDSDSFRRLVVANHLQLGAEHVLVQANLRYLRNTSKETKVENKNRDHVLSFKSIHTLQ